MKGIEIRDFCGDYALDIPIDENCVQTIFFNSRRNAETVKRIMEVDDSVPNAATVCDMVEVVRCKDCIHSVPLLDRLMCKRTAHKSENGWFGLRATADKHFCGHGERKEQT